MIQVGDALPEVGSLKVMRDGKMQSVTTKELFAGKKVVLFAVPGAFTPLCSAQHLPGFVAHTDPILAKGVDAIVCMAVNDAFVMDAWGKQAGADRITMLADGNGEFAKALGLDMDASGAGMGVRSQRFALIADDAKVSALEVEKPMAFEVSKAEHVLSLL